MKVEENRTENSSAIWGYSKSIKYNLYAICWLSLCLMEGTITIFITFPIDLAPLWCVLCCWGAGVKWLAELPQLICICPRQKYVGNTQAAITSSGV